MRHGFDPLFDLLMERYGVFDHTIYINDKLSGLYAGWYRYRHYHDGGWLEGYDLEPVMYWGA